MKANKAADEKGFVAELIHFASDNFLDQLFRLFTGFMHSPQVPIDWRKTIFNMLPKHGRAKVPAEYRAIASIRLLYKTFAYMILGRVEPFLEAAQPEGQHGFRSGRRIEEHLVTANLVIDKSWSMNMPIWIISLNTDKTKVMPTEAQPPSFLSTPAGLRVEILDHQSCHKWLGCMLSMPTVIKKRHDVDQQLQAASKPFFCHRATLCDRNVSLGKRLRYFDAVISPVAVFVAGHRTMYKTDLRNFDVLFRKLLRSVVGPPAGLDWTRPWHEILHD